MCLGDTLTTGINKLLRSFYDKNYEVNFSQFAISTEIDVDVQGTR